MRDKDLDDLMDGPRPGSVPIRLLGRLTRDPVTSGGMLVTAAVMIAIVTNAAFMQKERHPAPLFETRPFDQPAPGSSRAVRTQRLLNAPSAALVRDIQTGLAERGFYQGPIDGVVGPVTGDAIRGFERAAGLLTTGEPSERLLAQIQLSTIAPSGSTATVAPTPIPADRDAPAAPMDEARREIASIQTLLNKLGYGPLTVDGYMGSATSTAISRFEKDQGLPVTGALSAKVIRDLQLFAGNTR
ncbi:MAG: peptidoglycan-binding protein [Hyphomicrobiales bacterium]|nr:MAG: peptidoglycan-binding protein [Hyphomicrobiales bacterium]